MADAVGRWTSLEGRRSMPMELLVNSHKAQSRLGRLACGRRQGDG
jgi:hypothetical protein